jgi:predicted dehydrogenase
MSPIWCVGFGQQEVTEVYAEAATRLHDVPVDDCGLMLLTLADGMVVSLDASWSRPAESYPTWGDVTMEVTAQHGIVNLDVFRFTGRAVSKNDRTWQVGWGTA